METGKAIYKLLKDSSAVGAICADRIFPEFAQQDADAPFVVYTVTDTQPGDTKSSTSKIDTARVEVYCVGDNYDTLMNLGIAVRGALDRQGGDISGVQVQSISFDTSDVQFDPGQRLYVLEHTYNVRIQRTGTAGAVTLFPSNTWTIEEVDGGPSGAVNKLIVSNATLTINGNTATLDTGGGSTLTIQETNAADSATATTLEFPANSVTHAASKATISLLQGLAAEFAGDAGAGAIFTNGLVGDIDQDGTVSTTDLLALLGNFGNTASPTSSQLNQSLSRAQSQITDGSTAFFSNSRVGSAQATVTALTNAGHVVEYFEGINSAQGRGFISNYLADIVADSTVRRTMYISATPFPTALSQMQQYPLGPYNNVSQSIIQTVVDAYINSITSNGSVLIVRTIVGGVPNRLLDTYTGAAAAYSVRKLDKDYSGNSMRVRRSSDDSEINIGFNGNGDLDTSSIATHCGSSNGYLVTWFDQVGSHDATQSTTTKQPQIYDGSAVLLQGGKPAVKFDGTNDHLETTINNPFTHTGGVSCIAAVYKDATSYKNYETIMSAGATGAHLTNELDLMVFGFGNSSFLPSAKRPSFVTDIWTPSGVQYDGTLSTNERRLLGWYISNWSTHRSTGLSNMTLDGNGINTVTYGSDNPGALNNNPMQIGVLDPAALTSSFFAGSIQELILYPSDQNSNRSGIQTDMNSYFSIF